MAGLTYAHCAYVLQLKKENAAKEARQVKHEEELRAKMKELQVKGSPKICIDTLRYVLINFGSFVVPEVEIKREFFKLSLKFLLKLVFTSMKFLI